MPSNPPDSAYEAAARLLDKSFDDWYSGRITEGELAELVIAAYLSALPKTDPSAAPVTWTEEALAEALYDHDQGSRYRAVSLWATLPPHSRERWLQLARIALRAPGKEKA